MFIKVRAGAAGSRLTVMVAGGAREKCRVGTLRAGEKKGTGGDRRGGQRRAAGGPISNSPIPAPGHNFLFCHSSQNPLAIQPAAPVPRER